MRNQILIVLAIFLVVTPLWLGVVALLTKNPVLAYSRNYIPEWSVLLPTATFDLICIFFIAVGILILAKNVKYGEKT